MTGLMDIIRGFTYRQVVVSYVMKSESGLESGLHVTSGTLRGVWLSAIRTPSVWLTTRAGFEEFLPLEDVVELEVV